MFASGKTGHRFVDRGDIADYDFSVGDFNDNGFWHELDLSEIIPVGVAVVKLSLIGKENAGGKFMDFRRAGEAYAINKDSHHTQVANKERTANVFVVPNSERKIEYRIQPSTWAVLALTVVSWWI